jgi:hypothetical protein
MAHKNVPGDGTHGNGSKGCGGNMMAGEQPKSRLAEAQRLRGIVHAVGKFRALARRPRD